MPRSQEIHGKKARSQGKKHPASSSNSSTTSNGKQKKLVCTTSSRETKTLAGTRLDDVRNYTSSESSGLSSTSTVVLDHKESQSRDKLRKDCIHKSIGCSRYFYSYVDRNRHAKHCIFGFFKTCQEPICENQAFVGTFADYVEHAHTDHSVPLITASNNEQYSFPVQFSEDFCKPTERAYSSKVLVGFNQKTESESFNLALYAVVKSIAYGRPVMQVVPAIYASNKQVYHFARVKLALQLTQNNEEKQFKVFGGMRHQSHLRNGGYKVIVPAFNSPEQLMTAMQVNKITSYAINDVKEANQMLASVEFCRVQVKHERKVKLQPYILTWEETNLQKKSLELLPDYQKEHPDPITAVLLPQLNHKQNILLEFIDVTQVLQILIAQVHEKIQNEGVKEGPRNPKLLILFPDELTLAHAGKKLKKFIIGTGISAVLIPPANDHLVNSFEKCGTDILISTPDALKEFLERNPVTVGAIVFSTLNYIVLPFADHATKNRNATVVGEVLANVADQLRKRIARLAITPYLDRNLVYLLRQTFFERDYKLLSVGESPASQIRGMGAVDVPGETLAIKIDQVLKILSTRLSGKCLIVANSLNPDYDSNYDNLLARLMQTIDPKNLSLVRTMTEAKSNPNAFDGFQLEPKGVLLTSYFCLHFAEIIQLCEGIIIFSLPASKPDLARLTTIARKENGARRMIYNLKDKLSPNKITADYFVD